jgi:hypothetical protein
MKTVNILTINKEPNYGACLQAYALYATIEKMGYAVRMIDLSLDYRSRAYNLKNRIMLALYRQYKAYAGCFEKAEAFSDKHCPNSTPRFYNLQQLRDFRWKKDDFYIIGSDQVWNPNITGRLSRAYTFSFLPEECLNRFSYAASLGYIDDEQARANSLGPENLRKFKRISVRERFGLEFLQKFGIKATEVVDPTLLLDDVSGLLERPIAPKKELLFLALSDTAQQQHFVNQVAQKAHLPIHKVYGYLQPNRSINKKFLRIEDWLQAIAEAELVITDSFHATVFSILFHRQFYVYISAPSKVYRIANLLDKLGISTDRIVSDPALVNCSDRIDYSGVDKRLAELRASSLNFLKEILSESI